MPGASSLSVMRADSFQARNEMGFIEVDLGGPGACARLNPKILMMQTAQQRQRRERTDRLNASELSRVLAQ